MNKSAIALALVTLLPHSVGGQAPGVSVETLYADVKAKEKAVRTALTDPSASSSLLKAVRTVVADYEALVRRFPASAYSDDALWFAGWLAIDAFERFRDEPGTRRGRTAVARARRSVPGQQAREAGAAATGQGRSGAASSCRRRRPRWPRLQWPKLQCARASDGPAPAASPRLRRLQRDWASPRSRTFVERCWPIPCA